MTTVGTLYDETVKFGTAKLLTVATASNSTSLDFVSGLAVAGFDCYWFSIDELCPSTLSSLLMRISSDSGSTWVSAANSYWHTAVTTLSNLTPNSTYYSSSNFAGSGWDTFIFLSQGASANNPVGGRVRFFRNLTSVNYFNYACGAYDATYLTSNVSGSAFYVGGGVINGIRFYFQNGNIASGTIRLYGMRTGA